MEQNDKITSVRLCILRSVDKPLDKITVNEICENAGVSRQTFYNYFESKYMLRSWWSEYCERSTLDRIGIDLSWEEGIIRYVREILSLGNFIFLSAAKDWLGSEPYEYDLITRRIDALTKACSIRGIEVTPELKHCIRFYAQCTRLCGNEISALGEKAFTGIDTISKRFVSIVPAILYDALQLERFKKRSQLENYALMDQIVWKVLNTTTMGSR